MSRQSLHRTIFALSALFLHVLSASAATPVAQQAERLLETTGVQGGLIVHAGCGDGRLTAALGANEACLVVGLDVAEANVKRAREHVQSQRRYGRVSTQRWDGKRLPFIDNLVNLVVAEDIEGLSMGEVMRVLAPRGVAYIREDGVWKKTVKPCPAEIDEWTHYRYDATGNAVAHDEVVGPPRHMQWVGSPRWSRHHDHMASLSALVSAGGRVFCIIDEGPKASIQLPPEWKLVARDAFNGTVLWKRPIETWYNHLWPLKSGPAILPRRLVAVGDRVYVTLGINAPLSELDAATGQVLRTFSDTATAEEILHRDGKLIAVVNPDRELVDYRQEDAHCWTERDRASKRWGWDEKPRQLVVIDVATVEEGLWRQQRKVMPLTLAADGRRVVFHDGDAVVCLDLSTGEEKWRNESLERGKIIPTGWSPNVVLHDGVVLFSGQKRQLVALDGDSGQRLWDSKLHPSGHFCPEDVIVMDGLVWSGDIASSFQRSKGTFTGRDPRTGQVEKEFKPDTNPHAVMHQRCYPSKATDKYLMPSWIGIEFIDPQDEHWQIHHWVRGGCVYGVMPCNGLVYATPHSCACYYQSKLAGFCALAPARAPQDRSPAIDGDRLEEGPAYGNVRRAASGAEDGAWPTYRHGAGRSGHTKVTVPTRVSQAWSSKIGGKLSSLTAAAGKLFVAAIDRHTLYALDETGGEMIWQFTAGGRIDSPPTIYQGRVLFGSADGWVYCLRATDGALAWRFRAAPDERFHVAYEQVESVWPVHGSVLVQDDVLYCVAGRSMFLDGGLRLLRLDPKTGKKLSETVLDDKDPQSGRNLQTLIVQKKMPVALPDVLSSDGKCIYMRSQRFDLEGRRLVISPEKQQDQEGHPAKDGASGSFRADWCPADAFLSSTRTACTATPGSRNTCATHRCSSTGCSPPASESSRSASSNSRGPSRTPSTGRHGPRN
jgi:outer membrane protein assembly factor BamB